MQTREIEAAIHPFPVKVGAGEKLKTSLNPCVQRSFPYLMVKCQDLVFAKYLKNSKTFLRRLSVLLFPAKPGFYLC